MWMAGGRSTQTRFSDDVSEGCEYTPSGQVSRAIDGNGNSVQYQYNSLGKVRKRTDQLGYSEEFQYDGEGNLRLYVDRNGNRVCRTYNVFGNLVYEKAENQEGKNPVITTFRYDSLGRIRQAVCDGHSYEYIYNDQGLIKEKRSSGKCLISYEYDKAGQITKMTDPAGTETAYEYDLMGRTSRIFNGQGMEVRYRYDSQDRIRELTYGNHVVTEYDYDGDGNVSRLETKAGEDILLSFRYAYDGNGNRTARYGEQATAYGRKQKVRTSYRYDIRGQLVEEKENGSPTSYTYDAAGNRTGKKTPERVTRYSYNGKNQLTEEAWDTGKNIFTYDRQGSILRIAGTERSRRFTYNSKSQQLKVDCEDGQSQENLYDAEGLRYGVKENGITTRFVYHQGELLQEEREGGRNSYYLGSGIEAAQMGGELYYYHQDEQLSTALLTDHVGKVRNHYRYSAFGEMLEGSESVGNRIRYTGQQYDEVSGQYYLRARYYNPVVGRFLQEDVYQGDGLNLYAYCGNNPVRYYDPSGYAYDESEIGGDGGEREKYYFRGTTEGYEGNASLQRLGITPASTDPLVSTLFATEAEQYGKGVVYIASTNDLKGVTISEGNVLSDLEREVGINILPKDFSDRASIEISSQDARNILKDMGYSLPNNIYDKSHLNSMLKSTPRLNADEIIVFVEKSKGGK